MPPLGQIQSGPVDQTQTGGLDQSVKSDNEVGKLGSRSVEKTQATPNLPQASAAERKETKPLDEFNITEAPKEETEALTRSYARGGSLLKEAAKEIGGATWNKLGVAARGIKKGATFVAGAAGAAAIGGGKLAIKGGKAIARAVGNKFSNLASKVKSGIVTVRKIKLPRPHLPSRPKGFKLPGKSIRLRSAVKIQAKQPLHTLQTSKAAQQQTISSKTEALETSTNRKAELKIELAALKNPEQLISHPLEEGDEIELTLPDGEIIYITGEADSAERVDSVLAAQENIRAQKQEIKDELATVRKEIKTTKKERKAAERDLDVTDRALTRKTLKREKLVQQASTRTQKQKIDGLKDELSAASKTKKSAKKNASKEAVLEREALKKERTELKETLKQTQKTSQRSQKFRSEQLGQLEQDISKLRKKLAKNPELKEDIEAELQTKQTALAKAQKNDEGRTLKASKLESQLTSKVEDYDQKLEDTKKPKSKSDRHGQDRLDVQEARKKKADLKSQLEDQQRKLKEQQKTNKQTLKNIKSDKEDDQE